MATPAAPSSAPTSAPAATTTQATTTKQPQNNQGSTTSAATTATAVRSLKLKLDGQDVEMPESEVIALAQRGKVSDKRFQEAAALKKQADDVMKFAKENPAEFFAKTGMNARQWAEEYLMGELKREQMTPEQRKAEENEGRLRKYEEQEKAAKEAERVADLEKVTGEHRDRYDKMFVEALNLSGLPKTAYTIKRMAELQQINLKKKFDLGADKLAKLVREDYINEHKQLFGALEGDQLLDILGPELVKKLSKAQIAKLKSKGVRTASAGGTGKTPGTQNQTLTWSEYQRQNRRKPPR